MSMEDPGPTPTERLQAAVKKWQTPEHNFQQIARVNLLQIRTALETAGFICSESGGPESTSLSAALGENHMLAFEYVGYVPEQITLFAMVDRAPIKLLIIHLRRRVITLRSSPHTVPQEFPYSVDVILDAVTDYVEHLLEQKSIAPVLLPSTE